MTEPTCQTCYKESCCSRSCDTPCLVYMTQKDYDAFVEHIEDIESTVWTDTDGAIMEDE
jgi:hypothetical protein